MAVKGRPDAPTECEGDEPMHILDLPQLHNKPSASSLLSILSQLSVRLSSWDLHSAGGPTPSIDPHGVASYLTRIISSPLDWIEDEEDREEIWENASKRLSERSGRSAMPSLSRTFRIPVPDSVRDEASSHARWLEIQLYEPSLIGDNLGHKTWIASYLLAKRLPVLLPRHFSSIKAFTYFHRCSLRILELGAGTGLVGLAASSLISADIHLTDLAPIVPNLQHNIQQNAPLANITGSTVTAGVLDWSADLTVHDEKEKYDIIVAADSLYAPEHTGWLVSSIKKNLRREGNSRIFIELPLRPSSSYPSDFKEIMEATGFELLEDGEETGYDDWENSSRQELEVTCWWGVWAWASTASLKT